MSLKRYEDVATVRRLMPPMDSDEQEKLRNAIHAAMCAGENDQFLTAKCLRKIAAEWSDQQESLTLRATCHLVSDLYEQGWRVRCDEAFLLEPPGLRSTKKESIEDSKSRLRAALIAARDRQLDEASVQSFIARVSRPVRRENGSFSIADVIDNGATLANELAKVAALPEESQDAALARVIKPAIEVCDGKARCEVTGLKLIDIWRFFRHTWSLEYRSIPGRKMPILIRNYARPGRPVMGIALLASPVVRVRQRDRWIGWLFDEAIQNVFHGLWPADAVLESFIDRINQSIAEIRTDDLLSDRQVASPDDDAISQLERRATRADYERSILLSDDKEYRRISAARERELSEADFDSGIWLEASEDALFIKKRAETLAGLLDAKRSLQGICQGKQPLLALRHAATSKAGVRAIETALTEFRKVGLASQVMDVSVCGAVAPYNGLLAGKLVALLLSSKELDNAYKDRYGSTPSLIASQMAGRPIIRSADLKILTTTSLYGVGSSQYNRLVIRADAHHGIPYDIEWSKLGNAKDGYMTSGYGTAHLSRMTTELLRAISREAYGSRRINNRFGEGASPRLRQIREGLEAIGIDSGDVLKHSTPRLIYGCELVSHAKESLVGISDCPIERKPSVASIGRAWRRRWLGNRIRSSEVLDGVRKLGPETVLSSLRRGTDKGCSDTQLAFET